MTTEAERANAAIEREVEAPWEAPVPFTEATGPAFPVDALPQTIRPYIEAQAEALQVPVDLTGNLAIGVGAAAGAGRCNVELNDEWVEPLNIFEVIVMPSGERKSPALRSVTAPLEERERELVHEAKLEIEQAKAERDILEMRLKEAKSRAARAAVGDRPALMSEVEALTQELCAFCVPSTPRLLADDATPEAVASLLAEHGGRIAIVSTEGGLFETLAGRYSDGTPNLDVFLKGYSGDPLRVDRKGRPPEFVPSPALTVCLMVQPEVIRDLATKRGFRGRGLLARFLYSIPRSMVGYRSNTAPSVPPEHRERWNRTIRDILKLPDPPPEQKQEMSLSPEAHRVFQEYRDEVEAQLRPGSPLSEIADWGNKLPGVTARIAGILHLFEHAHEPQPWTVPISRETIDAAIELGRYYTAHALVAFSMMGADPTIERARRIWATVSHLGLLEFTQRELHQKVRRSFSVAELNETLSLLSDMGYIRPKGSDRAGPGRPSPKFLVNPMARTQSTQNPQNPDGGAPFEDSEDSVYEGREQREEDEVKI